MSNGAAIDLPSAQSKARSHAKKSHPTFHFLAGLTSGISSAILLQPADLLKTRVQQSRSTSLVPVLRSILAGPSPITTLWRGTVPSALRTGFGSALYFSTLNTLRQLVANNTSLIGNDTAATNALANITASAKRSSSVLPKLSATANLLTGATARVMAGFVLMPVTVIKVRYESDMYAYNSLLSASRSIYKTEGIRGFFSGLGATAVRDAPYAGLYVVFYEAGKSWLSKVADSNADGDHRRGSGSLSLTINATSGVLAATGATAITNPFDAVKTRLQLMPQKYTNMIKAARLMMLEEGPKCFFDGLGLRMARKAVSSALAWTVYEELIGRAERKFVQQENKSAIAVV